MTRQSFVYGAAVLVAASLYNRVLGFIYQILIIDLIGANGIGLFNMVYPIYVLAIVIATLGIPLAVSKYVAEEMAHNNPRGAYRILKVSLVFLCVSGALVTLLLHLGTPLIMKYIFANPKVLYIFKVLIPGVFVVSVCSAFRGYFQGLMQMKPTALSQMLEQTARVILGLIVATILLPRGVEYAAIGASLGILAGEIAGLFTMIAIFLHKKQDTRGTIAAPVAWREYPKILRELCEMSIPVTLSRLIATIILSLEASLIPKRLQVAGYTLDQATTIYGQLTGMAITVLVLPSVLTSSLATTLVPAISEAAARNNHRALRSRIIEAIRLTLLAGLPSFFTFIILPRQITDLLFHSPEAGDLLQVLSVGGVFYYLQQTTTGILQGLGQAQIPLRNLFVASVLELVGLYYMTGLPELGITGAAWAVSISFIVVASMNLWYILPYTGWSLNTNHIFFKPLFSSILMTIVMYYSYKFGFRWSHSNAVATLSSLTLSGLTYVFTLIATRAISPVDVERIPYFGENLSARLRRLFQWWN